MANPQIHQADVVFEHELARNTVVSASYILSVGRRLPTFVDVNLAFPTSNTTIPLVGGPLNGQSVTVPRFTTRINNSFNAITEIRSTIKSDYNALVLQFNRRYTDGLQYQVNYTYSKANDNGQATGTFTNTNAPLSPYDYSLEAGPSNFDIRHRFVASAVWTPEFFGEDQKVGRAVFNGFNIAPVFVIQSGFPYSMGISGTPTAVVYGPTIVRGGSNLTGTTATGRIPFVGRNGLRFPRFANFDLRISRRFRIKESMAFEVLAESFNLFNRTQVIGNLDTVAYIIDNTTAGAPRANFSSTFQTIQPPAGETLYKARQFQFAFRFEF
jgi:hypothetical protein